MTYSQYNLMTETKTRLDSETWTPPLVWWRTLFEKPVDDAQIKDCTLNAFDVGRVVQKYLFDRTVSVRLLDRLPVSRDRMPNVRVGKRAVNRVAERLCPL